MLTRMAGGLLLGLLVLPSLQAVTLGELRTQSGYGEMLEATIELNWLPDDSIDTLSVSSAPRELYEHQGVDWHPVAEQLEFILRETGAVSGELVIRSPMRIELETLPLLLDLKWREGSIWQRVDLRFESPPSRMQTILDSVPDPVHDSEAIASAESPPVSDAGPVPRAKEEIDPLTRSGIAPYGPVRNRSLDRIAMELSRGRPRGYLHMMYLLYRKNPHAFYRDNMNNLKSGVMLEIPSDEELAAASDREVFRAIKEHYRRWREARLARQEARTTVEQAGEPSSAGALLEQVDEAAFESIDMEADPDALHDQLTQLLKRNEQLQEQNSELRNKLERLEADVSQLADRLLADVEPAQEPPVVEPIPAPATTPASESQEERPASPGEPGDADSEQDGETPFWWWLLLPLPLAAFFIHRAIGSKRRSGSEW